MVTYNETKVTHHLNASSAFVAGIIGGAVMSVVLAMARALGFPVNLSMMLGTIMVQPPSAAAWLLGFVTHLIISGLIGLIYGWGFEHLSRRAGWDVGLGFSLVHTLIGGVVLGLMPLMHPLIPEAAPAPGMFLSHLGSLGVIAFFLYGMVVGSLYRRPTYGTSSV